jgi:hypothetical protein
MDKNNVKALYRETMARLEMNQFEEAERSIEKLKGVAGAESEAAELAKKLRLYVDWVEGRGKKLTGIEVSCPKA